MPLLLYKIDAQIVQRKALIFGLAITLIVIILKHVFHAVFSYEDRIWFRRLSVRYERQRRRRIDEEDVLDI